MTTAYIEVACASQTNPHAYTIAAPMIQGPAPKTFMPKVPRYCTHCRPPAVTDETGIAIDRRANVHGGVFIKSWRYTTVEDHHRPQAFPVPQHDPEAA